MKKNKKNYSLKETFGYEKEKISFYNFDVNVILKLKPKILNEINEFLYSLDPYNDEAILVSKIVYLIKDDYDLNLSIELEDRLLEWIMGVIEKNISSDKTSEEIFEIIFQTIKKMLSKLAN